MISPNCLSGGEGERVVGDGGECVHVFMMGKWDSACVSWGIGVKYVCWRYGKMIGLHL